MTTRVRVYRRGPAGRAQPAELLPDVYGGIWDTWSQTYIGLGSDPHELKAHPGQVKLLAKFDEPQIKRTLALGSQGGGKTEGIITAAVGLALWHPGKAGGIVAPTRARVKVVWDKFRAAIPEHWVQDVRPGDMEIRLKNGALIQFFAAKRQARNAGSPFAGNDWHWAVEDEQQDLDEHTLKEVDARGRVNANYQVFSSATNESYGAFQRRVKEYELNPDFAVVRFTGPENSFTPMEHWEGLRRKWDLDTYRRKVLCEDVPIEGRVYPAFSMGESVKPKPPPTSVGRPVDITPYVTHEHYGIPYRYVVGVDFGVRVNASVILQCFRAPGDLDERPRERQWWIVDEIVTEGKTPDWHAKQVLEWFNGDTAAFIAVTGQDSNSTNPDKSDFVMFRSHKINLTRAAHSKRIMVHHRIAMVNALLHAADGRRRLYVDCDATGRVKARKVIDSLEGLHLNASDKPEHFGKGTRGGEDLTHYTDALGYALLHFENFRGAVEPLTPTATDTADVRKRLDQRWDSNRY